VRHGGAPLGREEEHRGARGHSLAEGREQLLGQRVEIQNGEHLAAHPTEERPVIPAIPEELPVEDLFQP
jgi:hypothetical protein